MLDETESRNAFQPAFLRKLDDQVTKSSPNLIKFRRHDHKGLVNMYTKGIDELLHGLGRIDEIRSKIGVFSRTQKLRFVVTRDFGGFCTRLDGFELLQRVTKTSRIKPSTRAHESTKVNRNSIKRGTRSMNSNRKQMPGGHKEERASFPTQSPYKVFKNPYL